MKFYTTFTGGTLLISANYRTVTAEGRVTKRCRRSSIGDAWTDHQAAVRSFEAEGRKVDRRSDFNAFIELNRLDLNTD